MTQTPTAPRDLAQYVTDSQTVGLSSSFWTFEFPGGYWATVCPGTSPLCLDLEASDPTLNVCDADPRMVLSVLEQLRAASTAQPVDPAVNRVRDRAGLVWYRGETGLGGWISDLTGNWSAESDLLATSGPLTPVAPADAQATPTAPQDSEQARQAALIDLVIDALPPVDGDDQSEEPEPKPIAWYCFRHGIHRDDACPDCRP